MVDKPGFLTSYLVEKASFGEKFSNFCLAPLVTAFGRHVKIVKSQSCDGKICTTFTPQKVHNIGIRILAWVTAVVLFPMTTAGVVVRYFSTSHPKHVLAHKHKEDGQADAPVTQISSDSVYNKAGSGMELPDMKKDKKPPTYGASNEESRRRVARIKDKIETLIEKDPSSFGISPSEGEGIKGEKNIKTLFEHVIKMAFVIDCAYRNSILEVKRKGMEKNLLEQLPEIIEKLKDANLEYETIRKLKRCLKAIAHHNSIFKLQDSKIHQFYYARFSEKHMLQNLKSKKEIPILKFSAVNLLYYEKDDIYVIIKGVERAIENETQLSEISWCHGTQSATIPAVMKTGGEFKPSGELRETKGVAFNGEHGTGSTGHNLKHISGVPIIHADIAISYATGGCGFHDEMGPCCVSLPKEVIMLYAENEESKYMLRKDLEALESSEKNVKVRAVHYLSNKFDYEVRKNNFHRYMKILWTLEPKLFEEKMIPIIKSYCKQLEMCGSNNSDLEEGYREKANFLLSKVFKPVLSFKESLQVYSEEEKKLITENIPVVVASRTLSIEHQKMRKVTKGMFKKCEYAYEGNLKLGTDLQYIFVPNPEIPRMKKYLADKVAEAKVYSLATLKFVSNIPKFQQEKRTKRTLDRRKYKPLDERILKTA